MWLSRQKEMSTNQCSKWWRPHGFLVEVEQRSCSGYKLQGPMWKCCPTNLVVGVRETAAKQQHQQQGKNSYQAWWLQEQWQHWQGSAPRSAGVSLELALPQKHDCSWRAGLVRLGEFSWRFEQGVEGHSQGSPWSQAASRWGCKTRGSVKASLQSGAGAWLLKGQQNPWEVF